MQLERLNGLWRKLESSNNEISAARNRFGQSTSERDNILEARHKYACRRREIQQRLTMLRSTFVVYILALHIFVFIRISF
ncbi:hypothetical protein RchiOBHm_Chr2g0163621 [Rosa chinensis]|uniref:Uncharacterized protein n=1 Tax=Rosa chinensis TaxID=74649 RepID=A0A2P6S3E0_ROSCH|nr:hypothetical protein RchiOBHm_Chr2g0163621 [Rosa chinensis]